MNMMPLGMGMAQPQMAPPPMPSPEQIEQAKLTAEACSWEEISAILRSDDRRNYSIDVETDATAFEDEEVEKQQSIEFLRAMTEMLMAWMPAMQANPTLAPLAKELSMFSASKFKAGRQFEEVVGDAFDQIKNLPPQPNPDAEKIKAEMALKEKDLQMRMQEMRMSAQMEGQKHQQDLAFKEKEHQLKIQGQQADLAFKEKELQIKERELGMKAQEAEFSRNLSVETAMLDRQAADEDRDFQRRIAMRDADGKDQDRAFQQDESRARLSMDQEEQRARRAMEADDVKGAGGMTSRQEIETSVASQIGQVADAIAGLQDNQMQVVQAIQTLFDKQEKTEDALLSAIKRLAAPRNIKRDPKTGRALGVEILEDAA